MSGAESGDGREWSSAGATIWCEDGHDPKMVKKVAGTLHKCPLSTCDAYYRVEVEVEVDPNGGKQTTGGDR